MATGWHCPTCGDRSGPEINLYRGGLFNAHSRRFDPRCLACGSRVTFHPDGCGAEPSAPALVITGSCAGGKTTLSYLLSKHHGFVQIDGDWVLEDRKAEGQRPVDADELHPYLLTMTHGLATLGKPVALAHIVPPSLIPHYQAWLTERRVAHRIVILMPQTQVLLARNETRICWPKTTPEHWVLKFHEDYLNAPDRIQGFFYDNSEETPDQTAATLARSMLGGTGRG